jgi:CRP-like cAMP-binding protein
MAEKAQFRQLLQRMPQFGELSDEIQQALAGAAVHRSVHRGQVIYLEGEPADSIYILETGWIKATRMTRDGREQTMLVLGPVELFGDIAALTATPYPATVLALEEVGIWVIPARAIVDLIQRHPAFAMLFVRRLGNRVLHYINLVEDLSLRSVEARLARTLLDQARQHDQLLYVPRRSWATYDQIAARLGTVRDVLSRALKTLESENLLKVEKQRILLLDPKGLEERSNR